MQRNDEQHRSAKARTQPGDQWGLVDSALLRVQRSRAQQPASYNIIDVDHLRGCFVLLLFVKLSLYCFLSILIAFCYCHLFFV